MIPIATMNQEWISSLRLIVHHGQPASPRNYDTYEKLHHTVIVDMRHCVLTHPERALSYQFMAAEAYWILSGSNRVDEIAPWNKYITKFSDDGETFFGAYGPKIVSQLEYIVEKLKLDPYSRQAGLTLWRENPPPSKDIPCTVAIFAQIRDGLLNLHVFMRSSDIWLGLPYDIFNFSMLGHLICCRLNTGPRLSWLGSIAPGQVYLTAASMHLYNTNYEQATLTLLDARTHRESNPVPHDFSYSEDILLHSLKQLRDTKKGDALRWWEAT